MKQIKRSYRIYCVELTCENFLKEKFGITDDAFNKHDLFRALVEKAFPETKTLPKSWFLKTEARDTTKADTVPAMVDLKKVPQDKVIEALMKILGGK